MSIRRYWFALMLAAGALGGLAGAVVFPDAWIRMGAPGLLSLAGMFAVYAWKERAK